MELDDDQFRGLRYTKTSSAVPLKHNTAKVNMITDKETIQEDNKTPLVFESGNKRLSGSGTTKDMREISKAIASMKPKE